MAIITMCQVHENSGIGNTSSRLVRDEDLKLIKNNHFDETLDYTSS